METLLSREELIEKIEAKENVSKVDTSEIKDMSELFYAEGGVQRVENFNQPLNDWDVSKVENMDCMFCMAISFNQLLNDWDVSNVTTMESMFNGANNFNQPLNDWDVSKVENMFAMFCKAKKFNQSLNDWDVSKVKTMHAMFGYAKNYTYSFKSWKLKSDCIIDNFLTGCDLWHLFNTVEDLPMQENKRIDIGVRKTWKLL